MVKAIKLFVLFFIISELIYTQTFKELSFRKKELQEIRNEIEQLDRKLKEMQAKEKQNLSMIDNYDKQLRLIHSLINNLEKEERKLNEEIKIRESELQTAQRELNYLRNEYEQNIVNLYKFGRRNSLELLLSSRSINQALIRYKYLEKFTEDRKHRIELITNKAQEVNNEREKLIKVLKEKENLIKEKTLEKIQLQTKIKEKRDIISSLRKEKDVLSKDIERKKQSAKQIAQIINQLIEQQKREELAARQKEIERQKQLKLKENEIVKRPGEKTIKSESKNLDEKDYEKLFDEIPKFSSFSKLRGNLPWPVNGRIINRFGENINPELNTITLNFGVDISATYGSPVRAIADGQVSVVHWLPGYGNIVIITHSEGFRTVYGYLSEVNVQAGQRVRSGEVIAKSGESLSGEMVHFEIWKEREKQNPEKWLARR